MARSRHSIEQKLAALRMMEEETHTWKEIMETHHVSENTLRVITAIEMYQSCNLIYQRVTNNLPGDAKVPTILHIASL